MKTIKIIFLLIFILIIISGCATKSNNNEIEPKINFATAWTILPGYLITNFHVVQPALKNITDNNITFNNIYISYKGHVQKAKVAAVDIGYDLCLLTVQDKINIPPVLPLASIDEPLHMGQRVYHIGYPSPLDYGFTPKYFDGSISSLLRSKSGPLSNSQSNQMDTLIKIQSSKYQNKEYPLSYLMTNIPIVGGSSGGPLFNEHDKVIGLLAGYSSGNNIKYSTKIHVSYSIPVEYITKFCIFSITKGYINNISIDDFIKLSKNNIKNNVSPEDCVAMVIVLQDNTSKKGIEYINLLHKIFSKSYNPPIEKTLPIRMPIGVK